MVPNDLLRASLSSDLRETLTKLRAGDKARALIHGLGAASATGMLYRNAKCDCDQDDHVDVAYGRSLAAKQLDGCDFSEGHIDICRALITELGGVDCCESAVAFASASEDPTGGVITSIAIRMIVSKLLSNVPDLLDRILYPES